MVSLLRSPLAVLLLATVTLAACRQPTPATSTPPVALRATATVVAPTTTPLAAAMVERPIRSPTSVAANAGAPKIAALEPQRTPSPAEMAATPEALAPATIADLEVQTPTRDLVALAERLRHIAEPAATPIGGPADRPVGYQSTFSIADQVQHRYFPIAATIRVETAHAYFYVQDGLPYDAAGLQQAAQTFETSIYPTDTAIFGLPREPAADGSPRLSIVDANIPGVGGYFSASDEYPTAVIPYSNQTNAIYVNAGAEPIGSSAYLSTIAHELQHMIHWNARPHDDSWVNEGMSMLAERLNGYAVGSVVPIFLNAPDVQLDAWAADPAAAVPHYGAAYLFLSYFADRFGGPTIMKELLASRAPDLQMFANYLSRHAPGVTVDDVFADWVIANQLDDPTIANGRYAYPLGGLRATPTNPPPTADAPVHDTVHQYAARYYDVSAAAASGTLHFQGTTSVPLMQQPPASGLEWWSNRADTMDTTLTRPVDLTGVTAAQLDFSLWMDIEDSYDYLYVETSTDGGATWTTLPGTHSTTANPNGQNYGNGYTGRSATGNGAPGWLTEQVDLTPYAGSVIQLRFEYVTDEAYSGPGVGLRDIAIPAIGFDDAASGHTGWTSAGWLLTDNRVPERFIVQVIAYGATPAVYRLALDAENRGSIALTDISQPGQRVVVVVSALAPKTSEAGDFTLTLSAQG